MADDGGVLAGDFYRFERLLSGPERETLHEVRDWLAAEVAPIANRYWERAEFPCDLIPGFAELGIAGIAYDEVPGPAPSALLSGFLSLELSHCDPSFGTFYGVHSGLAMGSIARCGSRRAAGPLAAGDGPAGEDRRVRADRADRRFGRGRRPAYHGPPGRGPWVLDGSKRWIGNATFADHVVVWAKDAETGKVLGFVVRRGQPRDHRDRDRAQDRAADRAERRHRVRRLPGAGGQDRLQEARTASRTRPRSCAGPAPGWPGPRSG